MRSRGRLLQERRSRCLFGALLALGCDAGDPMRDAGDPARDAGDPARDGGAGLDAAPSSDGGPDRYPTETDPRVIAPTDGDRWTSAMYVSVPG